jgi:hypothetical protein
MQYVYLVIFAVNLLNLLNKIVNEEINLSFDLVNFVPCAPLKCKAIYPILLKDYSHPHKASFLPMRI